MWGYGSQKCKSSICNAVVRVVGFVLDEQNHFVGIASDHLLSFHYFNAYKTDVICKLLQF